MTITREIVRMLDKRDQKPPVGNHAHPQYLTTAVTSLKTTGGALITGGVEIVAGTGITLSQDDVLKKITLNSAGGDAISIKGIPVDATATTDGYVLTYDAVLAKFVLKPKPEGGGELLQVISRSQITGLVMPLTLTAYQNI